MDCWGHLVHQLACRVNLLFLFFVSETNQKFEGKKPLCRSCVLSKNNLCPKIGVTIDIEDLSSSSSSVKSKSRTFTSKSKKTNKKNTNKNEIKITDKSNRKNLQESTKKKRKTEKN